MARTGSGIAYWPPLPVSARTCATVRATPSRKLTRGVQPSTSRARSQFNAMCRTSPLRSGE